MERIHCASCQEPKFHQTVNFYGKAINDESIKCLSCGRLTPLKEAIKEATNDVK
jgi:hypothetical protein